MPVGRDAGVAQEPAVGRARQHRRHHRDARPELRASAARSRRTAPGRAATDRSGASRSTRVILIVGIGERLGERAPALVELWPGRMRQLTVARASCGSALSAWPPSSRVATQVVRICALYGGSARQPRDRGGDPARPRDRLHVGGELAASRSSPSASKYARVVSLSSTGNSSCDEPRQRRRRAGRSRCPCAAASCGRPGCVTSSLNVW